MSKTTLHSEDKRMQLVIYETASKRIVMAEFTSPDYHDVWHCQSKQQAERRFRRITAGLCFSPLQGFGGIL